MKLGEIAILNVGYGDTRLKVDNSNPIEVIRSKRIVTDMLRRGYALLVEVPDGKGGTRTTRVLEYKEATNEYIIADLDPLQAAAEDRKDAQERQSESPASGLDDGPEIKPRRGRRKTIKASATRGVAVAPTAGGLAGIAYGVH